VSSHFQPICSLILTTIGSGDIIPAGGAFLKGTTKFDNVEFGASTKDAASMTASTRRMIELGFLAMLDSGIDSRGKKIGTFIAGTNAEHFEAVRYILLLELRVVAEASCRMTWVLGVSVQQPTPWQTG
jgi:hypothetical protein